MRHMNNVPVVQQIPGFFNFEKLYDRIISEVPPGGAALVEVGCLWGASTSYLAYLCRTSNKPVHLYAIDRWDETGVPELGEPGKDPSGFSYQADGPDIMYKFFLKNIAARNLLPAITPLKLASDEAAVLFPENSVFLVFLDGSHKKDDVMLDIRSWWGKVTENGYIGGHDWDWPEVHDAVVSIFPEDVIEVNGTSWLVKKTVDNANKTEHKNTGIVVSKRLKNEKS